MAKVFTFSVPGVKCAACVSPIENATLKCKKVKALDVYVDIIDKKVSVEVDDSPLSEQAVKKALVEAIEDIGYECKELKPPYHTIKGIIGILAGSVLLGLCISGLAIPFIGMLGIGLFSSFLTFYLGKETYIDAFKKIRHGYITMDTLFSISTLVALGVSLAGFFIPSLPMMYDAALLIFGFRHIGKAVEESAKTKIRNGLNFRSLAPKEVTTEGLPSKKPVEAVTPGEVITLYPGEVIPLDGICLDQQSSIFNTIQTGLASPQLLKKDDIILAGFKVPPHVVSIRMKVTANEQNSFLAKLDRDLVDTQRKKAPLEETANKILKYFVPGVFLLAMVAAITIGTLFSPLTALQCATAILVSACPCTFGLITPLAVKIGIVKAAAEGIRFKSGQALQAAAQVDTVVFDLNGTLTTGKPEVSYASDSLNDYFGHIAAIEELSEHPFAKAILQHISKSPTNNPALKAASSDKKHHSGIAAVIDGESYILGNSSMMLSHGIDIAGYLNDEEGIYHKIYFAKDKQVLGYFLLKDPLRPDAKATVARLKQMGKKVHLCTGADKTIAQAYAKELNIDYVKANCSASSDQHSTPSGTKTAYIEAIAKGHKVAMVGDALNDTLAIEASAFGIAVESDATHEITQQKAGAVIHKINNEISLKAVITALTVAQHTVSNIKQNFLFSISYNMLALFVICSLVIGIGFVINPALGALLMAIQSSLVLANAYRFKNQPTHATNDCFYAENQLGQNSHALARTKLMPSPKVPTAIRETERPNKIRAQNLTPTPLTASPNHFFAASPNTTARGFDGAKHIKAMNPP